MQVISGDETGLLKLIDLSSRTYFKYGEQNRSNSISDIMYLGGKAVLSIKANSMLDIYSIDSTSDISLRLEKSSLISLDNPVSCHNLIKNSLYSDNNIILYNSVGSVSVYNINQDYNINEVSSFNATGPIEASDSCNDGGILFGGRENDAKLFNIETKQEVWIAKNVSQDKLHLRVPIWITSLAFQSPLQDSVNNAIFFAGTAHKNVRLYDTKASQQPVISLDIGGDFRVSAIQPYCGSSGNNTVYVSDTSGGISLWDLRQQRRLQVLKGAAGSIRKMTLTNDGKYLSCVGLDRFLRIYDTTNNKVQYSMYLKNRLNTCLFVKKAVLTKSIIKKTTKKYINRVVYNDGNDDDLLEEIDGDNENNNNNDDDDEDDNGNDNENNNNDDDEDDNSNDDEDDNSNDDEDNNSNNNNDDDNSNNNDDDDDDDDDNSNNDDEDDNSNNDDDDNDEEHEANKEKKNYHKLELSLHKSKRVRP